LGTGFHKEDLAALAADAARSAAPEKVHTRRWEKSTRSLEADYLDGWSKIPPEDTAAVKGLASAVRGCIAVAGADPQRIDVATWRAHCVFAQFESAANQAFASAQGGERGHAANALYLVENSETLELQRALRARLGVAAEPRQREFSNACPAA
jgi:hypothetical protein